MAVHRFEARTWHSVLAELPAALRVADGDTVITETLDASGLDKHGSARAQGGNPMNGPIHVEGAEPGDVLQVEILRMTAIREHGWTRGALAANVVDPERVRDLPPRAKIDWIIDAEAGTVRLKEPVEGLENFILPIEPMLGCFGVAPAHGQSISTATSAENGGNMDYRGFGPGARIWFPVLVPGALFFLGDCHAIQGDGEIVGTGVETAMEVEIRLSVLKDRKQVWPRGETAETIYTVGNARPLDQALQHATTEMFDWLMDEYGLSSVAASHLMGQAVRYEVGNLFDPVFTMVCHIPKKYLPKSQRPR
ncbi:acetamidase/formamidase family protein [Devosia sp.]|uniref:acetamidase/formamidase family protein n=1 Tax=Devosia sp. TaxID=1871048 RepID=UPI001AC13ABB|nr:acetamidase/formamidase family protein [Devosia sp.]MBN9332509.1 acetamidase/formamidase family protein [Devosia sp.]